MGHFGVYTNCQGRLIYEQFLSKFSYFKEWKFTFLENYTLMKNKTELDKELINDFDIFLYQPVDQKHGVYTTLSEEGILGMLKPSCLRISFPSVYADIWPIYEEKCEYYGGECILQLISEGKSLEYILDLFKKKELNFNLKERFEMSLEYMREREKDCSIKCITTFIEENIHKSRLFYTQNHPTEDFIAFIAGEVCAHIESALNISLTDEVNYSDSFVLENGIIEDSLYIYNELGFEYMSGQYEEDALESIIKEVYENPSLIKFRSVYLVNPSTM